MKSIGFIDYYISEWHANNYSKWFKAACEKLGKDYEVKYAYAELDRSPVDGRTTDEWCAAFGVTKCESIAELCEKADCIVILAPSNPEKHLSYAKEALKYGKKTYIDKTFAPDYATAREIFDIAEKYGTPFFTTSALRFADELTPWVGKTRTVSTYGGGALFDEYIIHQSEMVVKLLGSGATELTVSKYAEVTTVRISYPDDREALMNYSPSFSFMVNVKDPAAKFPEFIQIKSSFFADLICDMVRFFEEGTVSFDTAETLEVMKIREAAIKGDLAPGTTIKI